MYSITKEVRMEKNTPIEYPIPQDKFSTEVPIQKNPDETNTGKFTFEGKNDTREFTFSMDK